MRFWKAVPAFCLGVLAGLWLAVLTFPCREPIAAIKSDPQPGDLQLFDEHGQEAGWIKADDLQYGPWETVKQRQ